MKWYNDNKILLWLAIIVVLLVMGWFCNRMVSTVRKQNSNLEGVKQKQTENWKPKTENA